MHSVEEALAIVLEGCRPRLFEQFFLERCLGQVLAQRIVSDMDLPPFDKALVDGFAVRSADCQGPGPHSFAHGEEIPAGKTPTRPLAANEAAVIMTGAPLPWGADAVVMHEKTQDLDNGRVSIPGPVHPGEGMLHRGREMKSSQILFEPGERLNAVKLGVLASVGYSAVEIVPRPSVIILPTGDELVSPNCRPGPGQIRETNSTVLAGLVRSMGGDPVVYPVSPDEPESLRIAVSKALASRPDVLLLCGGVSAGKRDLVPAALAVNGVKTLFHKVRVKPGKPLLFGVWPDSGKSSTHVYGLPGNPVSGIVGFLLFVAPVLVRLRWARLKGEPWCDVENRTKPATLAAPFRHRGDRPTYHPARFDSSRMQVTPLPWSGSSDLYTVSRADGFVRFPAGDCDHEVGDPVEFLRFPDAEAL